MASSRACRTDSLLLYDYVRSQLTTLIHRFGLQAFGHRHIALLSNDLQGVAGVPD